MPATEPETPATRPIPARDPVYPLAASPDQEKSARPSIKWRSADGKQTARLDIPRKTPADRLLYVEFSAGGLVGQPVVLGGLRSTINDKNQAVFDWDELHAVQAFLHVLLVGTQQPWVLIS